MSEETWREIASKLNYCHGTSSKSVNSIKKYGLLPRKTDGVRGSVYGAELESKHLDAVYLSRYENSTPGFCHVAANNASEKLGGEPRIVNVKLKPEDFDRFIRDEDSWSEDYTPLFKNACEFSLGTKNTAGCFESGIKKHVSEAISKGKLTREEACNPPKWFAEIGCLGKFAVKDGVPSDQIVGVRKRILKENRYEWIPETQEE